MTAKRREEELREEGVARGRQPTPQQSGEGEESEKTSAVGVLYITAGWNSFFFSQGHTKRYPGLRVSVQSGRFPVPSFLLLPFFHCRGEEGPMTMNIPGDGRGWEGSPS